MVNSNVEEVRRKVEEKVEQERTKPFRVAVMGRTGVGKSSLINSIFGTDFETDPVKPCTKEVQKHVVNGADGSTLEFIDIPGIGEAGPVSQEYIAEYVRQFRESDVILWAIHADVRSVASDEEALKTIAESLGEDDMADILGKTTFVMTKSDLVLDGQWILARQDDAAVFAPTSQVRGILERKSEYLRSIFIDPYSDQITSETFNDGSFDKEIPGIDYDEFTVTYNGCLTEEKMDDLIRSYPEHEGVFQRLHDNHRVLYCSAYLKYNLYKLLLVTLNKLGLAATLRFEEFLPGDDLNEVPFPSALSTSNLVYYDQDIGETVFNPASESTPEWWNDE